MTTRKRSLQLVILALAAISALAQESSPAPAESPSSLAVRLLHESVSASHNFSPEEECDLLLDAARAAQRLDREASVLWAIRLIGESQKLTPGHYRSAMQKNGMVTLAQVDAAAAAELYMQQDDPPVPRLSEDIRAYGTQILYPSLWARQGLTSLDRISEISAWLGTTGEYPYGGVASILPKIKEKDPEKANEIFLEAVTYLGRGPDFSGLNRHYVDFVLKTWSIPEPSALRVAIQKGLDSIERSDKNAQQNQTGKKQSVAYRINAPKESFEIHSESAYLIYRLSTVAAVVDPRWPIQIRAHFSDIAGLPNLTASDTMTVSSARYSGDTAAGVTGAFGRSLQMQLPTMAQSNPQLAMDQATQVSDPIERSISIATVLPAYSKVDSSDTSSWLTKLQKIADSLASGEPKLRLLVQLAEAELALLKDGEAWTAASHAGDLGEELFAAGMEANPGKMAYTMPGFDSLLNLARTFGGGSALSRGRMLSRVDGVHNEILASRMRIAFAEGIGVAETETR